MEFMHLIIYAPNCGEQARRVTVRHLEDREQKRREREETTVRGPVTLDDFQGGGRHSSKPWA